MRPFGRPFSGPRSALALGALAAALTTAALVVVFELWRADLRVPFAYNGDLLLQQVIVKALAGGDLGGAAGNATLPATPDLSGVRLEGEPLNLAFLLAMASMTGNPALAVNLFVLASFPVAALAAVWAGRAQGLGRPASIALGILFAFLPLHVSQALDHPLLAALWGVPIAVSLALALADGQPPTVPRDRSRWRRTLPLLAPAILVGLSGWLVAFVAATMLVIAAGIGGIRRGPGSLLRGLVLAAVVLTASGTALVPYLLRTLDTGIGTSGPQPTELTSGTRADLAELALPVADHRVPQLAAARARYAAGNPGLDREGGFALGVLGMAGLVALATSMLAALVPAAGRWASPVASYQGVLVLGLLVVFGFGGLLALAGALVPFLDRWTPVAAFVGFLSLLALGRLIDRGLEALGRRQPGARPAALGLLAAIVALGVADQASPAQIPDYQATAAAYERDRSFVGGLEQRLPEARAVFQLLDPTSAGAGVSSVLPSEDQLRPYLHTDRVRWDGSGVGGIQSWQRRLWASPVRVLVPTLVTLGFDAIALRRPDDGGEGTELERTLSSFLGVDPISDLDERWLVFDLSAYKAMLEDRHDSAEREALATSALAGGDLAAAPFLSSVEEVAAGFREPVGIVEIPGSRGALLVAERAGLIRLLSPRGGIAPRPVLDLRGLVKTDELEQGLLGVAFHPRFLENRRLFVDYTSRDDAVVVAEYRLPESLIGPTGAGREILNIPHPSPYHNGGQLAFGPDGYLYVGVGDGVGDFPTTGPVGSGQDRTSLLGSILRIDVDRTDRSAYGIPPDNPFALGPGRPETWVYGLRNPWRFSFDLAAGDLFIADVGRFDAEEVNVQRKGSGGGENYGWRAMAGSSCLESECDPTAYDLPLHEYAHGDGRCAITGGYVYRGTMAPWMGGAYLFGDFCSGQIWSLDSQAPAHVALELLGTDLAISTFGQTSDGEILVADFAKGVIYRLRPGR